MVELGIRPPASPSCGLYPPACMPCGLEAEPEAGGLYAPEGKRKNKANCRAQRAECKEKVKNEYGQYLIQIIEE